MDTGSMHRSAMADTSGFWEEVTPGRDLVVAVGGIAGGMDMPPYEFFGLLSDWSVSKIFLRDLDQAWYQRGVAGLGSLPAVAERLHSLRSPGANLIVGNSAGGFAALLLGALTGFQVLAFSPQTYLGRWRRLRSRDTRWRPQVRTVRATPGAVLDLVPFLRGLPLRAEVHFAAGDRLDRHHAQRLSGLAGVSLIAHPGGDHSLIRSLRDTGELRDLLSSRIGA